MIAIMLVVMYPEQVAAMSWWYLTHMHYVIGAAVIIDIIVWGSVYRRYRKNHPYERVVLTK